MNLVQVFATLALSTISIIHALTINQPANANFASGDVIPLNVSLDSDDFTTTLTYSAVFSCAAGAYQLSNLVLGTSYSVIPPGIFGPVTLTVTATGCSTALLSINITPAVPNYPPAYVPVQLPHLAYPFPSLYAHFNENGKAEIDAFVYFNTLEEAIECSSDSNCANKHIKTLVK